MSKDQIDKFFRGYCSKSEAEDFIKWINSSENKQQLIKDLKKEWDVKPLVDSQYNEQDVLERINQIIDENYHTRIEKKEKQFSIIKGWYKYAASMLIMFSILFALYKYYGSGSKISSLEPATVTVSKSTIQGQKLKFMLPDNSMIVLNASSNFEYIENDTIRHITLSGEAFFEVAMNEHKPFVVHTGEVTTTAIGTAFNIFYREGSSRMHVSLIDGRVKVELADYQNVYLIPGEQAIFESGAMGLNKENWEYFEVFGWKEGILNFKDIVFTDIVTQLEYWYGVNIELNDNYPIKKHYTGKFNNEPLKNVLESLSFIYNFNYEINGNNVSIKFQHK